MTTIPTQIRARLDAIAVERARLDDEERRLKKALEALEDTAPAETSETPGLDAMIQERIVGPMYRDPAPLSSMPYPAPHYPPPMSWRDGWAVPEGPQIGYAPPWHPVIGKACGDVVTASDLNTYDV